jgi:hypothetical protein
VLSTAASVPSAPPAAQPSSVVLSSEVEIAAYKTKLNQVYTAPALKELCRARGLPLSGLKPALIARLAACPNPPPVNGVAAAGAQRGIVKRVSKERALLEGFSRWPRPSAVSLITVVEADADVSGPWAAEVRAVARKCSALVDSYKMGSSAASTLSIDAALLAIALDAVSSALMPVVSSTDSRADLTMPIYRSTQS